MIVPLFVLQFQTTPPPAPAPVDVAARGDRPVHVWLGSPSPLTRGSAVRVYVQVATDGNLVVLQRRTDGRIGVLFPTNPTGAPSVRAGTYEIHGPQLGARLGVAAPDGVGMILAARARGHHAARIARRSSTTEPGGPGCQGRPSESRDGAATAPASPHRRAHSGTGGSPEPAGTAPPRAVHAAVTAHLE